MVIYSIEGCSVLGSSALWSGNDLQWVNMSHCDTWTNSRPGQAKSHRFQATHNKGQGNGWGLLERGRVLLGSITPAESACSAAAPTAPRATLMPWHHKLTQVTFV